MVSLKSRTHVKKGIHPPAEHHRLQHRKYKGKCKFTRKSSTPVKEFVLKFSITLEFICMGQMKTNYNQQAKPSLMSIFANNEHSHEKLVTMIIFCKYVLFRTQPHPAAYILSMAAFHMMASDLSSCNRD
jgi:hypothetical protein